jgi:hypothetical protein
MLCQRCDHQEANVFLTQIAGGEMTHRDLCEECSALENPDGFSVKCLYCGVNVVNDIVCEPCEAELSRCMQSRGLNFPEQAPTPEVEQHMARWVAQRKCK